MYPNKITKNNYNVQELGLAKAFIKIGHSCDVVGYTDEDYSEEKIRVNDNDYITLYSVPGKNVLKNCIFNDMIFDLASKYDLVITQEYDQYQNIKLYEKLGDKVCLYHGPYYDKFNIHNIKYYLKTLVFDLIVSLKHRKYRNIKAFTKSELANSFLRKKGLKDVTTIGVGLDTERFNESISKSKQDHKQSDLLYIGRIEPRRNIPFIIKLMNEVVKTKKDIHLTIIGRGEKKYVDRMLHMIHKYKLENKITYVDFVDHGEVASVYNSSKIFLLPSGYEIFGMVLLEAMFFKMPVITTYNGGSSTLIKDGLNGYIRKLNIDEWKKLIIELINDEELIESISKQANNTIISSYTWDSIIKKIL